MKRTANSTERVAAERETLRRRVGLFYLRLNKARWTDCYELIDPQLAKQGKVNLDTYSELLQEFTNRYGRVKRWWTHISLHLDGAQRQRDKRPFAYVYVLWQDEAHGFHMFRERWIKDRGRWFTRVVGLVPNKQSA